MSQASAATTRTRSHRPSSVGQKPWDTGWLTVDGTRLRIGTSGSGPPLLLLMGIGGNLNMWTPFTSRLGGRRFVAFDAPGTGESEIGRVRRMRGLADLTARLLDELSLDEVDVLGYSFGGALAQELAHRHPARVSRLILGATACGVGGIPAISTVYLHMAHPLRYYSEGYLNWVSPRLLGGRQRHDSASTNEQVRLRLNAPPSVLGYAAQLAAITGWSSLPWLHQLRMPTLVMAGNDDPLIPMVNARLLQRRIPNARLHVVQGGGHLFILDQPEDVIDTVEAFLDLPVTAAG